MRKTIIKIVISLILLLFLRYYGLYVALNYNNSFVLNLMSAYNPMINVRPIPNLPPMNATTLYNETPLVYAIRRDNYELVKILLENGADPNAEYGWEENFGKPLKYCLRHGKIDRYKIAKLLLDYGAKGFESKDLLLDILSHSNLDDNDDTLNDKEKLFLEWMSKNYVYDNAFNYEIVYWAVDGNAVDEFIYMMNNYNIDLNYKNGKSQYILIPAARNRNIEFFKLLIDYGAEYNFIDENGMDIEDYIIDVKYDRRIVNNEYKVIDYNEEKEEMLKILNEAKNR